MRTETLKVPGATLHYEVRGSGPLLLLLPGSGGDAVVFDFIADPLAEHFTVAAIDPRGYSHSVLDSPEPVDQRVEVFRDDVHRLLEHLLPAGDSAYLFGGSGGAIVGIDLLAHHPEQVRRVVAHEPPCFAMLPDAEQHRVWIEEVSTLFHTEGIAAASARFVEGIGGTMKGMPDPATLPPRLAAMIDRLIANGPLMMAHELRPITSYLPDVTALTPHADRLVLAAGVETRGHLPYRPAATLAEQLGIPLTEFPGGHSGFTDAPTEFADRLIEVLVG
ncbi:alpha/beta fold hydrolase [Nocardia sp. NPDC052566]|uniref:alpha/beta fold hydrolase n=1 Tax=Nocardia sp. NPDC052566 TaxID=3364330 RepID=UPI0037C8B99E